MAMNRKSKMKRAHVLSFKDFLEKCLEKRDCSDCPFNCRVDIEVEQWRTGRLVSVFGNACELVEDILGAAVYGEMEDGEPIIEMQKRRLLG